MKILKKLFYYHTWTTKKGSAGIKDTGQVICKNGVCKRIYEEVPNRDIKHLTICVWGFAFTFDF